MNNEQTLDNAPLLEEGFADRRERHERHQAMLQGHKDRKSLARENHRNGWHKRKHPTNTLV